MVLRFAFCLFFLMFFLGCSDPDRGNPYDPDSNNYVSEKSSSSARSSSSYEDVPKLSSSSETQFSSSSSSQINVQSSSSNNVEQSSNGTTVVAIKTEEGTILRGGNLAAKLGWLERYTESHNTYILEMTADDNSSSRTIQYSGAIDITVILRGDSEKRTIRFSTNGTMFTIKPNVTFVLDNNITLQGHSQNTGVLVYVDGGIFIMNDGATMAGNSSNAVTIGESYGNSGTFTMNGGVISGNSGSGVSLRKGDFTMNNGVISGNSGNGVHLDNGTFSMTNGTIYGNSSSGVYISSGTFSMSDGIISNNTAVRGGGVYLNSGTFTMRGGTITGNTASEYGGGVYRNNGTFSKIGGIITGYSSDSDFGNVVKDGAGAMVRRGHAVYINATTRKETTSGQEDNLSVNGSTTTGGWDA